jgi:NAD(P)-dependent dehydrogenase (short-subunit alcohol dehydrogenase family)
MVHAVKQITEDHGAVGTLVNNAGSGVYGSVEDVPLETARASFETNVFGAIRLTQLVVPGMRAQGHGRIVNVSSVLGRFSPPGGGLYQATKHAIEAYSDALRLEVAPFGIRVCVIEPAVVRTDFFATAMNQFAGSPGPAYADFYTDLANWAIDVAQGHRAAGRFAASPERIAEVIESASTATRPRARYQVGALARSSLFMRRYLPDTLFDRFLRSQFPAPRTARSRRLLRRRENLPKFFLAPSQGRRSLPPVSGPSPTTPVAAAEACARAQRQAHSARPP